MTLGAARVQWSINDLSMFVDEVVRGYVFMVLQTERGPVGDPQIISSLEEYRRIFGRKLSWSNDPLIAEMALRQGARLIISRACHYTSVADPSTITALKSSVTLQDRGDIPLAGTITGSNASPYLFTQALSGRVTGTEVGPFTFGTGSADAVTIKVGAGANQAITLSGSLQTVQQVVDAINAATTDLTASATNDGKLKIVANTVTDAIEIVSVANDAYSVLGLTEGVYAASAGTDSVVISVDGGADQTFTLLPAAGEEGSFYLTAAQVASRLNLTMTGATATTVNGALKITSGTTGASSSIQVQSSSTADTALGLDNDEHTGAEGTAQNTLTFTAKDPGSWGDGLRIQVSNSKLDPTNSFNVKVISPQGEMTEYYGDMSMDPTSARYVVNYINERSRLVTVEDEESTNPAPANIPAEQLYGAPMTGGDDGGAMTDADWIGDAVAQTGMYSADRNFYMTMDLMIPGQTSVTVYQAMIAYCEDRQDMIAYGQTPYGLTPEETVEWRMGDAPWTHPAFNSHRFALFFGRIKVFDDFDNTRKFISNLGHLAACLCKSDTDYDYHYAPVGPRRGKITLIEDVDFNIQGYRSTGYADLFAEKGINYVFISHIPGIEGGMFWEQRTTQISASALRELNVIRFITYMFRCLMPVLRTFIFEPNHPLTWREIHRTLEPAFENWKNRMAIYDYLIQTDRDAKFAGGELKNAVLNTGQTIDQGIYRCRGLIQPTKAIYYLQFELGVTGTGQAFERFTPLYELPGWIKR